MAKSVFYSFHYDRDAWRVQQIIQMGALEGQPILNAQQWEEVKRKGDAAIETPGRRLLRHALSSLPCAHPHRDAPRPWA